MKILFVTDQLPYPLISGDRVRVYNLIKRVAVHHEVWLASLVEPGEDPGLVSHLQEFCKGVEIAFRKPQTPLQHLPGLARYAMAGTPLELKFEHSRELFDKVRELASSLDFDVVEFQHSKMAMYLDALPPGPRPKRVLVFHNVSFDQYDRIARLGKRSLGTLRAWLYSRMMRRWEPWVAGRVDRSIAMSDLDAALLSQVKPRLRIDVIPNGVDTRVNQPLPAEDGSPSVLFVGKMSYEPCADAVQFFSSEVLPGLRRRLGKLDFWIVGADPPPEVVALGEDPAVHVTGRVESVVPHYRRCRVAVVPLRAGGGTRLKILEAMALGRPVVSTTVGCEGLDVADGENILVADSPAEFLEKTAALLADEALYQSLADRARQFVVERYDWDSIAGTLLEFYADLTRSSEPGASHARRLVETGSAAERSLK